MIYFPRTFQKYADIYGIRSSNLLFKTIAISSQFNTQEVLFVSSIPITVLSAEELQYEQPLELEK